MRGGCGRRVWFSLVRAERGRKNQAGSVSREERGCRGGSRVELATLPGTSKPQGPRTSTVGQLGQVKNRFQSHVHFTIYQSFIFLKFTLWRLVNSDRLKISTCSPPKYGIQTCVCVWRSYAVCFMAYLSAAIECMCIYLCMWTSWKAWWAVACRPCHQARYSGRCRAPCSRSSPSRTATACGSRSAEGWPPERCNTGVFQHECPDRQEKILLLE